MGNFRRLTQTTQRYRTQQGVFNIIAQLFGHIGIDKTRRHCVDSDATRTDFFSHRVFVFTPKSDVIDLPTGATPIDFAYAIHSDLGDKMSGARVNGKMVSLDTPLKNGDLVDIITKPAGKPSRKWHDIAKTNMAKKHIRAALAAQEKNKNG